MKKFLTAVFISTAMLVNSAAAEKIPAAPAEDLPEMTLGENSEGNDTKRNFEIQLDYLQGRLGSDRQVDNYNVHFMQKMHEHRALTFYRGLTFSRATGYTNRNLEGILRDSNAVGIGVAGMFRWKRHVSGKFYMNWDLSGSFLLYNRAHPAQGRAYGFLWRTGPSFTWNYRDDDSFTVGYYVSHVSNGMKSHNPGYNTMGFSLGVNHKF